MASQVDAILLDVGGVLLHPDDDVLREAVMSTAGVDLVPSAATTAIAATVWHGAASPRPEAFWASRQPIECWATLLGLPTDLGVQAWLSLNLSAGTINPLWRVVAQGARDTLAALKAKGFRLAAVSNNDGRLRASLEAAGIAAYFDEVVDSAIEGVAKPDPLIFALAAKRLGTELARCVMIGDDPYFDVRAAMAAGVRKAILIDPYCMRPLTWSTEACSVLARLPAVV
ncbi:HAD-IA family hydrolase [Actinoplanes sp. NPDC051633]|uniref:HAD family hydrolase n=1 Tax=Actinoplanes sp. NPDC051633 TaxID=3155670 RepID=UPI003431CB12